MREIVSQMNFEINQWPVKNVCNALIKLYSLRLKSALFD